ncbi:hypothetical protein DL95DRAFT_453303 [Leptodontidium sp. 2 PMI_412]|nr:hypothetical protein DL95DRAFT_453303 [Leptodontidium sp. 2 PMI_412]
MGVMRFVGSFEGLDGVTVDTTGTINQIVAQVQVDRPSWKPNFTHSDRHGHPTSDAPVSARDNAVELTDIHKAAMFFWPIEGRPNLQRADSNDVDRVIRYLANVNGVAYAGPRQCVRIACLGDATAYLCNAKFTVLKIMTGVLATYVGDIKYLCLSEWNGQRGLVCGKETDTDGFNVIVSKQVDEC